MRYCSLAPASAASSARRRHNASKWALEGFSEALAQEVAPAGVRVTLVEPGPYGTDWSGDSAVSASPLPAYEQFRAARRTVVARRRPVDPRGTAKVETWQQWHDLAASADG